MHVSLDRHGRVVQAGEGSYNTPMGVDEVDNSLSNPNAQAAILHERNCIEYATMAAIERRHAFAQAQDDQHTRFVNALASEYEEQVAEESAEANGGENPLLYAAAMQTMAGRTDEHWSPISGYMLSEDGTLDYARGMSGNIVHGMGQVQALIQTAQQDAQAAQSAVAPLIALAQGGSPAAPAPAPGAAAPAGGLSNLMSMKVGGIPAPYIAGAVLAFLLLRK